MDSNVRVCIYEALTRTETGQRTSKRTERTNGANEQTGDQTEMINDAIA